MKDSPIASNVQPSKVVFAMSRESWQIFSIFALATGLAFEVFSISLFSDSRSFVFSMTILCLVTLVGLFFLGRTRSFPMTDRTRAQSALVITAFLVAGLIGIWFGSKLFSILVWSVSLTATVNLGREYATGDSSN